MTVLPTRLGVRFLLLVSALVLVYFVTAYSNLFFLLLCLLGTVLGMGAISSRRAVAALRAELGSARPAPVGTPALVPLRITAAPARGAAAVTLTVRCGGASGAATFRKLQAGSDERCALEGLPRGVHKITSAVLDSSAPLGLFRARKSLPAGEVIVVPPRPLDPSDWPEDLGRASPMGGPASARGATQPAALREWKPGDEIRRIHWKASARGRGLVVREMEEDVDRGIEVVLDARCGPDANEQTRFEQALGVIAGLGHLARDRKEPLTVLTQRSRRTYGEGFASTDELMEWLAAAEPLPQAEGPPPVSGPTTLVLRPGASP